MVNATYQVYIDWDADGGLQLGGFETGADGWSPGGTVLPTFAQSTTHVYHGAYAGLITWGTAGTGPCISKALTNLVTGRAYTLSAWVYVPAGSPAVKWTVVSVSSGSASAVTDAWVEITHSFTATGTSHTLQIVPDSAPTAGHQAWVDLMRISGPGEVVSSGNRVLEPLSIEYGRDQARTLTPPRPGEARISLRNDSGDYSPDNGSSPLAGLLGPGREVRAMATYSGACYSLHHGYLDGYEVRPELEAQTVEFTTLDGLARLKDTPLSTAMYPALRTGEAVHVILNSVGWTGARDVDPGGTTLRWWSEETNDALGALNKIVAAEGPTALAYIGPDGQFIFRDRHHRLIRSASITSQVTLRADSGAEPVFLQPFAYDAGWRDVVNSVTITVNDKEPGARVAVWEHNELIKIAPGQTVILNPVFDGPVWDVQVPTVGTTDEYDLIYTAGSGLFITFSRVSGKSMRIELYIGLFGSTTEIVRFRLMGSPLQTVREFKVTGEDAASIAANGRKPATVDAPHINGHDADAVVTTILGLRATRMPSVKVSLNGANATRMAQQLTRQLSDRVHLIEPTTGLDADFYVESIAHSVSEGSQLHQTSLSCTQAPPVPTGLFRFDVAGLGFDDGVFAASGLDDPDTIFLFDVAGQGFDDGLFAT